jgi:cytochrome d ubiquinol oxidase subunit I
MSTGDVNGVVEGVNDLQKSYEQKYGAGDYTPNIPLAYWGFRLMIGFGGLAFLLAILTLWLTRRGRELPTSKVFARSMAVLPFLPLIGISFGWIFTESARQPWVVFGLMKTADGVSPTVGAGAVAFTMIVFTLLYGVLAVIEFGLMIRTIKVGPEPISNKSDEADKLVMAY